MALLWLSIMSRDLQLGSAKKAALVRLFSPHSHIFCTTECTRPLPEVVSGNCSNATCFVLEGHVEEGCFHCVTANQVSTSFTLARYKITLEA